MFQFVIQVQSDLFLRACGNHHYQLYYTAFFSVHEYGGGSFIVSSDQVYFVTENGVYLQKDPHAKPQRIVQASKNCRFADLDYFNVSFL